MAFIMQNYIMRILFDIFTLVVRTPLAWIASASTDPQQRIEYMLLSIK
jgi:hypothetical protein